MALEKIVSGNMRNTMLLVVSVFFLQCSRQEPELIIPPGSRLQSIILKDANAVMQIYMPAQMDSSARWEYNCCAKGFPAIAFRNHDYPLVQEYTGECSPLVKPDSMCQLTIQTFGREGKRHTSIDTIYLEDSKKWLEAKALDLYQKQIKWNISEIKHIGGLDVAAFAFTGFSMNRWVSHQNACNETILLSTHVNGNLVCMQFECIGSNCNGIIQRMMPYIETMRFIPDSLAQNAGH